MNKADLIAAYRRSRAEFYCLVNELDPSQLVQPLNDQGWTIKDIIAHLTWHEREMVHVAKARALVGSPWWRLPLDQRNENIYELFKDRNLDGVLSSADIIYDELILALEQLGDGDIQNPSHFAEMPSDWLPWQVFASNMHEHYQDHIENIKVWIEIQNGKDS